MNPLNMAPEVVQMLKSDISALGMLTPDPLAALLSLLAPNQVLVIEVVALCDKRETVKRDRIQQRAKTCPSIKTEPLEIEHKSLPSPDRSPLLLHAAECYVTFMFLCGILGVVSLSHETILSRVINTWS
ncbi:Uncharacterized protein HZ326_28129 [Fusarium oxysporum f. sp. albedinis]|nr:Uncharacterized protein HZ326_28129 [Fusarium oxysporum f. sp. albedinis]KAK2468231.1 hypothetical protein H9L39_19877 [Fusarium oxysporum f. sp. albedinis]